MRRRDLLLASEFPPFPGGISTYAFEMASALSRLGDDVTVLAPDQNEDRSVTDRDLPFEVVRYPGDCHGNRRTPRAVAGLARLLLRRSFDVVHAVDPVFADMLTMARKVRGPGFFWTLHGSEILSASRTLEGRFSRALGAYEAADRLLTNSEYTRRLLLERMPHIAAHKARVTFLGVSPFWFEPSTVADVRTELKLGHDCRLLLTAARITPRKGHHWVLEGLRLLPDAIKQTLTYVVAGVVKDQDYHRRLRELAARCGVPVVFTGPVSRDQLRALYDAASLLCMPGDPSPEVVEGLGLAYLEAAARGLPSIAGRLGGIPEAVLHDETGLLLERFDGRAVADALYALLTDDERRERLARAAAARAGRLSWEACARLSYE